MIDMQPVRAPSAKWRRDFALFWTAQGASLTGDQIREFAVPLIAITVLQVSATELGVLGAAQWIPFLLLALPFGVVIDRRRRRRMLLLSEVGRGALTAVLAVAALVGALEFPVLLVAAVLLGALTVVYEVGYQSAIPALVPREHLGLANSRIQATAAAGEIGGPGLGGLLMHLLGVATTLWANAAAHLISAAALLAIRAPEPRPEPQADRSFLRELRDGIRHVVRDRYLLANVGFSALYNPFAQWVTILLALYAVRTLELDAAQVGIIFSAGAAGALLGAAAGARASRGSRVGVILVACAAVECAALLAVPAVDPAWPHAVAIVALAGIMAVNGAGTALSSVILITVRQLRTPDAILGRVNATMRTVTYGTIPLGALAGGLVGDWVGARTGLLIGAILCLGTVVWVVFSPLRTIRRIDELEQP